MPMALFHPTRDELQMADVLHALSDPQRLCDRAHAGRGRNPRRCGSFDLDITKSTLTHHFRVLREAGVIDQREEGTARLNSLRRADLDERFPGLLDAVLSALPGRPVSTGASALAQAPSAPAVAPSVPAAQPQWP